MSKLNPTGLINLLTAEQQAVLGALNSLFAPLSQLCIAKGIRIQAVEDQLRGAFIQAARGTQSEPSSNRLASRISATTGLTRREVTRLERLPDREPEPQRSPVSELFTRWLSDQTMQDAQNKPLSLPRQGPAPSFESLARSVTRDLHPRTLLSELCRLQLATHDVATDTVRLLREAFVPEGDWNRMLAFLGDNVGDHLRAAVANVLHGGNQQLEQAIFSDELSVESAALARELMSCQWRTLLSQVAPALEEMMATDRALGRPQVHSLRIGLFTWSQPMSPPITTS